MPAQSNDGNMKLHHAQILLLGLEFHVSYCDVSQAVNQLCSHFEAYRDIPKITELREKFKSIKQILKSHVFSDFSRFASAEV